MTRWIFCAAAALALGGTLSVSGGKRTAMTLAPAPALTGSAYQAVALQNPNLAGVTAGFSLRAAGGIGDRGDRVGADRRVQSAM